MTDLIVAAEVHYDPPLTEETSQQFSGKLHQCLAVRNQKWLGTFLTPDGRMSICQFAGTDVDAIREAYETAGIPAHRVFVVQHFKP